MKKPIRCRCSFSRCIIGRHGRWNKCPLRNDILCYKFVKHELFKQLELKEDLILSKLLVTEKGE